MERRQKPFESNVPMKSFVLPLATLITLGFAAHAVAEDAKAAAPATAAAAPTAPPAPPVPDELKDPKALNSYSIGLNFGTDMRKDGVEIDPAMLARAVNDALTGAKPLITLEQARMHLSQLQRQVMAHQAEENAKAAAANKAQGDAFLKENAGKPGVVVLPSGLQYQVVTMGKGPIPKTDDVVVCNYRGTLIDGTEFDSSYARNLPASFPVGGVIKGWTEALQKMPVGSKWRLFIPANLAYGERGAGEKVGPNATLIFDVELLSITPQDK